MVTKVLYELPAEVVISPEVAGYLYRIDRSRPNHRIIEIHPGAGGRNPYAPYVIIRPFRIDPEDYHVLEIEVLDPIVIDAARRLKRELGASALSPYDFFVSSLSKPAMVRVSEEETTGGKIILVKLRPTLYPPVATLEWHRVWNDGEDFRIAQDNPLWSARLEMRISGVGLHALVCIVLTDKGHPFIIDRLPAI